MLSTRLPLISDTEPGADAMLEMIAGRMYSNLVAFKVVSANSCTISTFTFLVLVADGGDDGGGGAGSEGEMHLIIEAEIVVLVTNVRSNRHFFGLLPLNAAPWTVTIVPPNDDPETGLNAVTDLVSSYTNGINFWLRVSSAEINDMPRDILPGDDVLGVRHSNIAELTYRPVVAADHRPNRHMSPSPNP